MPHANRISNRGGHPDRGPHRVSPLRPAMVRRGADETTVQVEVTCHVQGEA